MSFGFEELDTSVPLALLPVRLEAQIHGNTLRVRIIPDAIHANAHEPGLTAFEEKAGHAYWTKYREVVEDVAALSVVRNDLAARTGAHRGVHITNATKPTNLDTKEDDLIFPKIEIVEAPGPVLAEQLPDRWEFRIYDRAMQEIFSGQCLEPVHTNLAVAPSLGAVTKDKRIEEDGTGDTHIDTFLKAQNLRWMVDFETAKDMGMAFDIDLGDNDHRLGAILVAGARGSTGRIEQANELDKLLEAHWYSHGVDVLAQGSATNNTDQGLTGHSSDSEPNIDALFALDAKRRPAAAILRAKFVDQKPPLLYKMPAADTVSLAFGMTFESLFDRTDNAELLEGLGGSVMNAAIGSGIGQLMATKVLQQHLSTPTPGQWRGTARHHIDWVRAAGPIPSLRVGAQPYGILPIQGRLNPKTAAKGDIDLMELILGLYPSWRAARPLATLDPDATDGVRAASPAATVETLLEVLGAVPHPQNLHLRRFEIPNILDDANEIDNAIEDISEVFKRPDTSVGLGWQDQLESLRAQITGLTSFFVSSAVAPSMAQQVALGVELRDFLASGYIDPTATPEVLGIYDSRIAPIIAKYDEATDAMPQIVGDYLGRGGVSLLPPTVEKPEPLLPIAHGLFDQYLRPIGVEITRDGTVDRLIELIDAALPLLEKPNDPQDRWRLLDNSEPLLLNLIEMSYRFVHNNDADELAESFRVLRARLAKVEGLDPGAPELDALLDELQRLQRETLSTFMNRLDAWITSFAARRLAELRAKTPRGVMTGGYGWLLDFAPSKGPISEGYIHTPSMAHATTAGILRSGWAGYGTSEETAPLSTDLSSDRVRGAQWILDGVRNGQDLSDILGARFERYLHDDKRPLDAFIDELRVITNTPKGSPRPAAQLIDGFQVARAFSAGRTADEQAIRDEINSLLVQSGTQAENRKRKSVKELCRKLARDLDAVSDLLMAESVHALAQGKDAQASSVLNMLGDEEGAVPEITLPASPTEGQIVVHRIATLCHGTSAAPDTVIGHSEPGLGHWLVGRLPAVAEVGFEVIKSDERGGGVTIGALSLSDIVPSALEAMQLSRRGASQDGSLLARLARARARTEFAGDPLNPAIDILFDKAPRNQLDLNSFGLIAQAARVALDGARPIAPADLVATDKDATASEDNKDLEQRYDDARSRLVDLQKSLENKEISPQDLRLLAAELAAIGILGAVDLVETPDDFDLRVQIAGALNNLVNAGPNTGDSLSDMLGKLIGNTLPILPRLVLDLNDPMLKAAKESGIQADVARDGLTWYGQICKVVPSAAALSDFTDLAASVRRTGDVPDIGAVQLPGGATESWAATGLPAANGRDRLNLFFTDGMKALSDKSPLAGFVSGTWTEVIPREDQQTALAYHFDAPSARAPQVILLSMLDEETGKFDAQVFDQLLNVIDLTKTRAVGADRVADLGHYAPASFVDAEVKVPKAAKQEGAR